MAVPAVHTRFDEQSLRNGFHVVQKTQVWARPFAFVGKTTLNSKMIKENEVQECESFIK